MLSDDFTYATSVGNDLLGGSFSFSYVIRHNSGGLPHLLGNPLVCTCARLNPYFQTVP
jgi:hypothetical protein